MSAAGRIVLGCVHAARARHLAELSHIVELLRHDRVPHRQLLADRAHQADEAEVVVVLAAHGPLAREAHDAEEVRDHRLAHGALVWPQRRIVVRQLRTLA
eukprot:1492151-Prymnesium_polylepis.2